MGNVLAAAGARGRGKDDEERERLKRRREFLARHGVLVPPAFGTSTDRIAPPSGGGAGSCCGASAGGSVLGLGGSLPHLWVESEVTSPLRQLLCGAPAQRLLGGEHLRSGVWIGASPSPDAHIIASVFDDAGAATARGDGGGGTGAGGPAPSKDTRATAALQWPPSYNAVNLLLPTAGSLSGAKVFDIPRPRGWMTGGGGGETDGGGGGDAETDAGERRSRPAFRAGIGVRANAGGAGGEGGGAGGGAGGAFLRHEASHLSLFASLRDVVAAGREGRMITGGVGGGGRRSTTTRVGRTGMSYATSLPSKMGDGGGGDVRLSVGSAVLLGKDAADVVAGGGRPSGARSSSFDIAGLESWLALRSRRITAAVEASVPVVGGGGLGRAETKNESANSPALLSTSAAGGVLAKPNLSYYLSVDLTDSGTDRETPPIYLTLHKDGCAARDGREEAAATVSQVITFDRHVANLLEDRCPKIRNTVAWAVRLKRTTEGGIGRGDSASVASSSTSTTSSPPVFHRLSSLSAAVAWQMNRAVCYKVALDGERGSLTGAVVLKRWAHPRVTCSVLCGVGVDGTPYQGLGLQIETGPEGLPDRATYADRTRGGAYVPETRTELPPPSGRAGTTGDGGREVPAGVGNGRRGSPPSLFA